MPRGAPFTTATEPPPAVLRIPAPTTTVKLLPEGSSQSPSTSPTWLTAPRGGLPTEVANFSAELAAGWQPVPR